MESLAFLILLEAVILFINVLITIIIYLSNKEYLFRQAIFLWGAFTLQFLTIGIIQKISNELVYESMFGNGVLLIIGNIFMLRIIYYLFNLEFKYGWYLIMSLFGVAVGAVAAFGFNARFEFYSFLNLTVPCIVGIILVTRLLVVSKEKQVLKVTLCFVFIMGQIHYLDYPLLRTVEWFAPYGFTMLSAIHVAFAVILPSSLIKKISDDYAFTLKEHERELEYHKDNLADLIKKRTIELEKTSAELVEASRQAGMSEIVTGTLHNVGNVLNSVNVSLYLVEDYFQRSMVSKLYPLVRLIEENIPSGNEKINKVPDYLREFIKSCENENSKIQSEADYLRSNIDDIKNIISIQQSVAGFKGLIERIKISDLIKQTVEVSQSSLKRHGIDILVLDGDELELQTDKLKIIQILVNLLSNAKNALAGVEKKAIEVKTSKHGDVLTITVLDNGVGISKESLKQIFNYGFTTSKNGHGYGLHHSVLSARELGGDLTAQSNGLGKGSTFTLTLPLNETTSNQSKVAS